MMGDMTDDAERAEEFARGEEFYAGVDNQTTYEARRREGAAKLYQAWAEIDALGRDLGKPDSYTDGFAHAISMALGEIKKLGGMDPQKRGKEALEMKPLIRELIEALEDFQLEHSYNSKKEALVARAKEALEND